MATVPHWNPSGLYSTRAVGVSFCRDEIFSLVRNSKNKEAFMFCCARLVPYDSNPHDPNAVLVEVEGIKVGHLSRGMASLIRKRLSKEFGNSIITSCDALISGGIEVEERTYEYKVELDFDLETNISHFIAPTYQVPLTTEAHTIAENRFEGCFYATGWLGSDALDNLDKRLEVKSWTTDHWDSFNYYVMHTKRCGLGHKFLSIPKNVHLEMFGPWTPSVVVTSIKGRYVNVKMMRSEGRHGS